MAVFVLIRHGDTNWPLVDDSGFRGHGMDLAPLTEKGRGQAELAASDPRLKNCSMILSSPYTRAMETAAILSRITGLPMRIELDLREWEPDQTYQFSSKAELMEIVNDYERHGGIHPAGERRRWEPKHALRERFERVLDRYSDLERVAVVAHGMLLMTRIDRTEIANCEINELAWPRHEA